MVIAMLSMCRFDRARQKIAEKYDHVERELIEEFRLAHQQFDKRKMKRVASVLQNFKVLSFLFFQLIFDQYIVDSSWY